jgi:hypothetical protein
MRNFIYTCNGSANTSGPDDAVMFPADKVLRMEPTSATTTTVFFMSNLGDLSADRIVLTHASLKNKEVMAACAKMFNMQNKSGFVVMSDFDTLTPETFPINNLDSTILVTDVQGAQG